LELAAEDLGLDLKIKEHRESVGVEELDGLVNTAHDLGPVGQHLGRVASDQEARVDADKRDPRDLVGGLVAQGVEQQLLVHGGPPESADKKITMKEI
jgi:hypothetical protein